MVFAASLCIPKLDAAGWWVRHDVRRAYARETAEAAAASKPTEVDS